MSSEAATQQLIRLEAARRGTPLLRNNSGACMDSTGRMIRYGLGNDSNKINEVFKSSDLIGICPVVITPDMVGRTLGVFLAVEVKAPGWEFSPGDDRAVAQKNFGDWVMNHGGLFRFATKPEDVWGG
jgi:hypothetical protein